MRIAGPLSILTAIMLVPGHQLNAVDKDDSSVRYVVRKGDTLINLGDRYLTRPETYKIVQRQNRIANPHAIPVGKILTIPRNLLKFKPAKARLIALRGQVLAGQDQASVGQVLTEGASLSTAGSSFATLTLDDGSRVSLPSNSNIRIRRLRSYDLGGSLDYDFDVEKGGIRSSVIKQKSADDRYQVRTPKAVSAVRGTDFHSRFDAETNSDFAEVVEGALLVGTGAEKSSELPAGNGLAVPASGAVIQETLLAPPELIQPGKLQADPVIRFAANQSKDASGYRISLAADAGFIDQVADLTISGEQAEFEGIGNGNYFIRARAISQNGIQGLPVTYAFKRRLNGVKASAGQTDDGYVFKWLGDGNGVRRHHFQLFRGKADSLPVVDEASLDSDRVVISDLPPGDYFWRVGVVQYLDGEMATNWVPVEKLTVAAP